MAHLMIDVFARAEDEIRFHPSEAGGSNGSISIGDSVRLWIPRDFDDAELFLSSLQAALDAGASAVAHLRRRAESEAAVGEAEQIVGKIR